MSTGVIDLVTTFKFTNGVTVAAFCLLLAGCGSGGENSGLSGTSPQLGAATETQENRLPVIEAISLGCDLATDSVALSAGETANFTLFVDDEFPLTLSYAIDTDNPDISTSNVDTNGVFTLVGVSAGQTTMPIIVTDEQGLSSQLLLSVVVTEA